jgi:DNA uptake protein ComE-like DNA-binding protein
VENPLEFSKKTRKSLFIFLVLVIVVALLPRIVVSFLPKEELKFSKEEKRILSFKPTINKYPKSYSFRKKIFRRPPSKFDPNLYTITDWMYLGLSKKQAASVIKFGKYGFKSNEQLSKVFVIPKQLFDLIKDSTIYGTKKGFFVSATTHEVKKETIIQLLELNSVSEEELLAVPGIGPFFAKNIIKQREKLGGFVSINQLLECWKFDDDKLAEVKPYMKVDPLKVQKLNINTATAEEFKKHPYFTWNLANSLYKIRKQKGSYSSIEEIKESVLVTEELFSKLKPYLTL